MMRASPAGQAGLLGCVQFAELLPVDILARQEWSEAPCATHRRAGRVVDSSISASIAGARQRWESARLWKM